jgi:pimeloyl-ACP methyl ester carboxylesterase
VRWRIWRSITFNERQVDMLRQFFVAAWLFSLGAMLVSMPLRAADLAAEDYFVDSPDQGIRLFVRNKRPVDMKTFSAERTLVYVHGATYPATTAFDLPLGGYSWMDFIARRGFDVYLLDLRGYGRSTRPPEMEQAAQDNPPLVRTETAVRDVATVVEHVLRRRGLKGVNLLGWSWGTTLMGAYAAANPDKVNKLVLFAPVWLRTTPLAVKIDGPLGAYRTVTMEAARKRWLNGVAADKQAGLIPEGWFEAWAEATWGTDPWGRQQSPPLLRAPNGVIYDIQNYWAQDKPLYDPAAITSPVLLIHAEWDQDTPAYMSQNLFAKLVNAAKKRYVVVGEGTHTVIMEKNRAQLFNEVQLFLEE